MGVGGYLILGPFSRDYGNDTNVYFSGQKKLCFVSLKCQSYRTTTQSNKRSADVSTQHICMQLYYKVELSDTLVSCCQYIYYIMDIVLSFVFSNESLQVDLGTSLSLNCLCMILVVIMPSL